jgi:hypothetical protein
MAGTMGAGPTDSTVDTRKLYKDAKAKLLYMEPRPKKVRSGSKDIDTRQMASAIGQFIKENSGEYQKRSIWSHFSSLMTLKEFEKIIDELHGSGKIAIDKEEKVGWIWNPKLTKKYGARTDLAFK